MSTYDKVPAMMRGLRHYRREGELAWLDDRDWMDFVVIVDHGQADAAAASGEIAAVDPIPSTAWRELRRR